MTSYLLLAVLGLIAVYAFNSYRALKKNLDAARISGIPYIVTPIYTFNTAWLVTHRLWLPSLRRLPKAWTESWLDFMSPDFVWDQQHSTFRKLGSDAFLIVAPGANTLYVADADAIAQITTRRNDFPKPTWMYRSVNIFGTNLVSTEGALWRHHRKITSPPFTEKNNVLVWQESLHQAQSMVTAWVGKDGQDSGTVWTVADQAMRLSLHVISKAGFGVGLKWPHEEADAPIPKGHTMSYKAAIETLLENIIVIMLTPGWLLRNSPFKLQQRANEAYVEWGKYMREMYQQKCEEVRIGDSEAKEGMDLMGALIKGAGITAESLNAKANASDPEKGAPPKQLLTDEEILGNAFVFILAGHETAANTIHFSILFLAMRMASQQRLHEDLDAIFGNRSVSEWDYEQDVPKLFGSMCGAVMNEELRLIPPVVGIPKSATKDRPQGLQLNGKHCIVPAAAYITLNTPATHRNPKHYPHTSEEDLNDFRPERWLLDPTKTHATTDENAYEDEEGLDFDGPDKRPDTAPGLYRPPKGAYIPFSEGYRSCIGRRFAQVEILAVLAVVFKFYTVELDVSMFLPDDEFATASEDQKRAAWEKAHARAKDLLKNGMGTIITIQMRKGKVPMRFVKRGNERFKFLMK